MILCPWKDISRYYDQLPGLKEAVEVVNALENPEVGKYQLETGFYMVQHVTTKPAEGALYEAHRNYADVQYVVKGGETMIYAPIDTLSTTVEYNPTKDKETLAGSGIQIDVPEGYAYIVFPEDAHAPNLSAGEPHEIDKIVLKLPAKAL